MNRRKKWSPFNALSHSAILYEFRFDPFVSFLKESENMIDNLDKELLEKYTNWEEKVKNKDSSIYPDAFDVYETEIMHQGEFRTILRNSVFACLPNC